MIDDYIGSNVIIFGVDMSSLTLIGNQKKDILIIGKGFPLGLQHAISTKKMIQLILLKKIQIFL